ncbi:MAG: alpha/beta hydrolase [Nocardioidaceae bacterium]
MSSSRFGPGTTGGSLHRASRRSSTSRGGLGQAPAEREPLLFRVAMAVIALHVLDDGFVNREPGTSAGDHLASGLVPVAVAVALAVAYPRLRAGARATVALACGALAMVYGIGVPVRHALIERPTGDDFTGLLVAPAGVVLLLLGVFTLWRSRRLDEPPARRYVRRLLWGLGALVLAYLVVVPIGFALIATHEARESVEPADLGRPHEPVSLTTSDGLRLSGWYVRSRNGAAVIAFPGRSGPVRHARMLARHGYGVLLLDRRGEGDSEGDPNAYGWGGEPDLRAAVEYLRRRRDVDPGRIGGLGLSVGGELLLQTAAHTPALRAVVSEGAGKRSIREQMDTPDLPGWRAWASPWLVQTPALAVLSNHAAPPNLVDLAARIAPRAVFLIRAQHGNQDEEMNRVYFEAAGRPKSLWEVPDGGHTGGLSARPREYERRVTAFFDRRLLGRPAG